MNVNRTKDQTLALIGKVKDRFFTQIKNNAKVFIYQLRPFMYVCDQNNTLYEILHVAYDAKYIDVHILNRVGIDPNTTHCYSGSTFNRNTLYIMTTRQIKRAKELSQRILFLFQGISRPHVYQNRYKR